MIFTNSVRTADVEQKRQMGVQLEFPAVESLHRNMVTKGQLTPEYGALSETPYVSKERSAVERSENNFCSLG